MPVPRKRLTPIRLTAGAAILLWMAGGCTLNGQKPGAGSAASDKEALLRKSIQGDSADPSARLKLVQFLLGERRHHDALDAAQEAAEKFPESLPVKEVLAEAQLQTARVPEAVATLQPLAANGARFRLLLARALLREGKRGEAARLAVQSVPSGVAVQSTGTADLLLAGQVLLDTFEPEQAVKLLQPVADQHHGSDELQTTTGLALLLAGRAADAVIPLERVAHPEPMTRFYLGVALRLSGDLGELPAAEVHLAAAAAAFPQDGLLQYELALSRVQLRQWAGAHSAMEAAAAVSPGTPEIQRDLGRIMEQLEDRREAALAQSRYLRLVGDPKGAIRLLMPLQKRSTQDVQLGLALAEAEYAAADTAGCLRRLSQLRKQAPKSPEVLENQFRAHEALNQPGQALKTLDELLKFAGDRHELMEARADLEEQLLRYEDAERTRSALRDLEPTESLRQAQLGAMLADRPGRAADAEAALKKALELDAHSAQAHYRLGTLLAEQNRTAEAIPHLRSALDASPETVDALRVLGRCYAQTGDTRRQEDTFKVLRRIQARDEERKRLELPGSLNRETRANILQLARFYVRHSKHQSALTVLEKRLHFAPADQETRTLLVQLYGHGRRFQRQFEERRLLMGQAVAGEARP